jgi:MoaA/NifB/PqqE/SkfB family radical SAM enzyme
MKRSSVQIIPSTRCNKNCVYCDIPKIKQRTCTFEEFKYGMKLANMVDSTFINLSGGEPGLLPQRYIDYLIDNYCSNRRITLSTNGEILPKIEGKLDSFSRILYHIFPEEISEIENPIQCRSLIYTIVMHRHNIDQVIEFLKNNKHINFLVIQYSAKELLKNDDLKIETINKLKEISLMDNVTEETRFMIDKTIKFYFNNREKYNFIRDYCSSIVLYPVLDLVNKRILKCCVSYTNSGGVELTEQNIKQLDKIKFKSTDPICENCLQFLCSDYFWYLFRRMVDLKNG